VTSVVGMLRRLGWGLRGVRGSRRSCRLLGREVLLSDGSGKYGNEKRSSHGLQGRGRQPGGVALRLIFVNSPRTGYLRLGATRAYDHARDNCAALTWIARHPQMIIRHPEWLRQRTAATMTLRVPWWPYDAVTWVAGNLSPAPRVFEYGGGGSTLWLEDLGARVTTVEHDAQWSKQLAEVTGSGTTLLFRPPEKVGVVTDPYRPGFFDAYAAAIDGEPDASLDLVIIDGRARIECARRAMPKVKPDGLLLFDDTDFARLRPVVALLGSWERHVFTGLKPGQRGPAQTSAWRRPDR
jgi:hypothetical protein